MTKVVLIHWGNDSYPLLAKKQAEKSNDVEFLMPNGFRYSYEADRWFILRDWMLDYRVQRCLYIDSDVLLYKDVDQDFRDCDMAFSKSHSGHTMFVNNIRILDDFCRYIEENIYNTDLVSKTRFRLAKHVFPDSVGDMVLLNNFMYNSKGFFRDTSKVINDSVYDHNINTEGVPEMIKGIPCRDGVRLNSIHFQGNAKIWMKRFME